MHADVERLLREWLGRFVPPRGGQVKAAVMELAVHGTVPKFNKYSGIITWANAYFLCVNAGGDTYANLFLRGGAQMTWFAQVAYALPPLGCPRGSAAHVAQRGGGRGVLRRCAALSLLGKPH